ncbi:hypothetical protein DEO72_LG11g1579 [Vigna unguiculata]|uniref:Uncharacterized protein n=1 Tax=Vigna unguiculata TaxID=3917 RepID=A0A4D6NLR2_VIGUN|nr:hypothetical protein DEO72_LG11g1579 [Vigna unguiculata]
MSTTQNLSFHALHHCAPTSAGLSFHTRITFKGVPFLLVPETFDFIPKPRICQLVLSTTSRSIRCDHMTIFNVTSPNTSTCGKTCYGSYTATPGRVLIYEHSPYHPKTTKLVSQQLRRAIYLDPSVLATTSTLTPATLANPSHNSRVPRVHPQIDLLPYLLATTDRAPAGKHATEHTPQRQVEFSYTNILRIVPRLPNSSANNRGGQSIWTQPYLPQPARSHRQHSPTRATTQGFLVFIRHPEPQLKRCYYEPQLKEYHVLNPYPEPQLKGYVLSHNSRNTSNPTLKAQRCQLLDRLAGIAYCQAHSTSNYTDLSATAWRNPQNSHKQMSCLAVIHYPPDGFWKVSRNAEIQACNSR